MPPPPPPPHASFQSATGAPVGEAKTSAAAIWSLILGLLSAFCCCISGVPGLILGIVALVNIGKSQGRLKGNGLALAGILLSCLLTVANSGVIWSMQKSTNPKIREFFDKFGEVFQIGQKMTKGTMQAQQIATALQGYISSHNGELPPDLQTLAAENLLEAANLDSPLGGDGAAFWDLTQAGKKHADLAPDDIVVKGGPMTVMGQQFYIVVRADWRTPEAIEAAKLPAPRLPGG
jgi:Domain of unknown function (DUF4190)